MKPQVADESFSRFFHNKIEKIRQGFVDEASEESEGKEHLGSHVPLANTLSRFCSLSGDHIPEIIQASKPTTAAVGHVSIKFLLEFTDVLLPLFQKIVNLSLESGTVPRALKKKSGH